MNPVLSSYITEKTQIYKNKLDHLSEFFKEIKVKKNEFLLREGEICRHNYFVVSGCIRVYTTNTDGFENTRYIAFEKKFITSITSLISELPSIENIRSLENSTLLSISKENFFILVEKEPAINKIYIKILESAYINSVQRIYDFQGANSLQRLRWLLKQESNVFNRISGKVIASYLGVTPFTLSRLRAKL